MEPRSEVPFPPSGQSCLQYKYVDLELSSTTSERRSSRLDSGDVDKLAFYLHLIFFLNNTHTDELGHIGGFTHTIRSKKIHYRDEKFISMCGQLV